MTAPKVIPKEDQSAFERWELPTVERKTGSSSFGGKYVDLLTAKEIEKIHKQAYEEGFASGQKDVQARCQQFEALMKTLTQPLEDLDEVVVQQIFDLSMAVAGQLIRRELHIDPGQVMAIVREALAALPVGSRNILIHLHPEDANLVRESFSLSEQADSADPQLRLWRIVDDPVLTRGGCRVETEHSSIDASLETQLNRLIASLLGGEREDDPDES